MGICENGLIYLSYGMAQRGFDFNSIDELEDFLDKFEIKINNVNVATI